MNIISGRISSRLLHKIINRNDIHSLIDENEELDEDFDDIQIISEAPPIVSPCILPKFI